MAQVYTTFHRESVNRLPAHLVKPRLTPADRFELPKLSTLHYIGAGPFDPGPPSNYPLFKNIKRLISTMQILHLTRLEGNPTKLSLSVNEDINTYHRRNKRYRRTFKVETGTKDPESVFLVNYTYIDRQYKYLGPKELIPYSKAVNTLDTVVKTMIDIAKVSDTHQYLFIDSPRLIPSLAQLRKITKDQNIQNKKLFNSMDRYFMWQLWLWCSPDRNQSVLAKIPDQYLEKINFIVQDSGINTVINLGELNKMRKGGGTSRGYEPQYMALKVIQLYLGLAKVRTHTLEEIDKINEEDLQAELEAEQVRDEANSNTTEYQDPTNAPKVDEEIESGPIGEPAIGDNPALDRLSKEFPEATKEELVTINENKDTIQVRDLVADLSEEEKEARELRLLEAQLDEQLQLLDSINERAEVQEVGVDDSPIDIKSYDHPEQPIQAMLDKLADEGSLSATEYKRFQKLAESYKTLEVLGTDDKTTTLEELSTVPEELLQVKENQVRDIPTVTDKRMLNSSLKNWSRDYIRNVMDRDVARMTLSLQNAGICVTDYKVRTSETAAGAFKHYQVRINPILGVPSTLNFKLPVLSDDGVYRNGSTDYRMKIQKFDKPIRKVSDKRVSLSSYYGKVFIDRSDKRVNNFGKWLCSTIRAASLSKDNNYITDTRSANVFDHLVELPYIYTTLAKEFRSITTKSYYIYTDYHKRVERFGDLVTEVEANQGYYFFGINDKKEPLAIDFEDQVYVYRNKQFEPLGDVLTILNIDGTKAPLETIYITVMGVQIPVGIVLAYDLGLTKLLKLLKVPYRKFPRGQRLMDLNSDHFLIRFEDEVLAIEKRYRQASILLSGFLTFQNVIKDYSIHAFDRKDVYLNILESQKITARYLNEINLMYQMFIDPITKRLLENMNEPTHFTGLLLRAAELLLTDYHPSEVDASQMRLRGYERMTGAVYSELIKAVRQHNNRGIKRDYPIELNPNAVWLNIARDPSTTVVDALNPIQNLKTYEIVTFSGTGGRSRDTMVKRTRSYDKNDLGVVSEGTVDSGDVGINVYLSANPQITSLYGETKPLTKDEIKSSPDVTKLYSTSSLLSVAAEKDDAKRRGFINIMHDHTVPCVGYEVQPVRTGYEQIVAQRTGKLFATAARMDGTIKAIQNNVLTVEYDDGQLDHITLGRRFGSAAGLTVPHAIKTDYQVGDKFKKDDILAYNPAYFTKDPLDPSVVSWKGGSLARVILLEDSLTLEDSCAISQRISGRLTTYQTKIKSIVVNFNQEVHRLVKIGTKVDVDTPICIIEDEITSQSKMFDEESIELLQQLSNMVPKAESLGVVEKIEVFYNGLKEDMSDTLRKLADSSDLRLSAESRSMGKRGYGGEVTEDFRVDGNPLALDTAVINVYITGDVPAHVGDKFVLGNQMKTTCGKVFQEPPVSEDNEPIDILFGAKSVAARIVNSMYVIGTTNSLLKTLSKQVASIYFSKDK